MTVAPVPGNGPSQARRTALFVIKLQLNCHDKGRRESPRSGRREDAFRGTFVPCCASTTRDQIAAALPKSVMKSRRLMSPQSRKRRTY